MTLALALCWGVTGCSDDGETMDGETTGDAETTGDETTGDETTGDETTGSEELTHSADIQPIWEGSCTTGCHAPGGVAEFLDLSSDGYDDLVGVASTQAPALSLVEAGASDMSYLVNKLRGTHLDAGGSGGTMPAGMDPLDEATIAMIESWIDAGAMP